MQKKTEYLEQQKQSYIDYVQSCMTAMQDKSKKAYVCGTGMAGRDVRRAAGRGTRSGPGRAVGTMYPYGAAVSTDLGAFR